VFGQPEIFDKFNENLPSGKRTGTRSARNL